MWYKVSEIQLTSEAGPYWAVGYNAVGNAVSKPTYGEAFDEMAQTGGYTLSIKEDGSLEFTEVDTKARDTAIRHNSELQGWVASTIKRWREAQVFAVSEGLGENWWATSEAKDNPLPSMIRQWFMDGVQQDTDALVNLDSKIGATYYTEHIISNVMAGVSWDDPFIVYSDPPSIETPESMGFRDTVDIGQEQ